MAIFNPVLYWLHILAAVVWIGGMAFNLLVVRPSMSAVEPSQRIKLAVAILKRFILFVWASIGLLIVTGISMALPKFSLTTAYGITLLFKIAIVGMMILIVIFIRYFFLPKLEFLIAQSSPDVSKTMGQIAALVKLNLVLGIFVLLLSEFLTFWR